MNKIVLASTSEGRQSLLNKLLNNYIIDAPSCDETPIAGETPYELCKRLGQLKAHSLKNRYSHHLIIGSDQVATFDNISPIGKPITNKIALQQLLAASGKKVHFYTSICLLNTVTGHNQIDVVTTSVQFRKLSEAQITSYIEKEDVRYCAGSFKVESKGIALFKSIESPDPTSLIGLPLIRLSDFLIREGVDPLLT